MATTTLVETSLGVRAIGNRTDFAGSPVTDISAEEDRFPAIIFTEGALKPATAFEPVAGLPATMDVIIGSGEAKTDYYVVPGRVGGQGNYLCRLEGTTAEVTLASAGVQSRIDEVYLVVQDDAYDDSNRGLVSLAVRRGDEDASPVAPGPDSAWEAYALIAQIEVPNTASDIEDCTVTDMRQEATIDAAGLGVPVGSVLPYVGTAAPDGFLLAQGQAVLRADYPALFALQGTTYGAGNGTTTFNLPDLRQRFPLGKAASGTGSTLGSTGGAIDHTHAGPSHTHSQGATGSGGSHTHTNPNTNSVSDHAHLNAHTHSIPAHGHSDTFVIGNTDGNHSHTFSDSFTTGGPSGTNLVGAGGAESAASLSHTHSGSVSGSTSTTGAHGHGLGGSVSSGGSGTSGNASSATGDAGSHSHTIGDTGSGGSHTHTNSATDASGTGSTGSANPPYIVLNYIIRAA